MPPTPRRRRADDAYDDDDLTGAAEQRAWEDVAPHKVPWPRTPDEADCRWTPGYGERGWLTIRDPFTGERHEVPTKYVENAPWRAVGGEPAPQWMVRRAMDKLPPKQSPRRKKTP
jgi:hypothetical protein